MCKMLLNEELNGVEIIFDGKPEQAIRDSLKANGFRWSKYKKLWYAKQNANTLKLAEQLAAGETVTAEQQTQAKQANRSRKAKKELLPLYNRVQFTPGKADISKYHYNFVGSNYTGLSTKETAAEVRKHLKKQFSEVKFSVRMQGYNSINLEIKESPYNRDEELQHILKYCEQLLSSYNFDNSDSMTDYFHVHFYKHVSVSYDYKQTEQTEAIKKDVADFRKKLEHAAQAEEEQQEREYKERVRQQELDNIKYKERQKETAKQIELINNSVTVKDIEEDQQYFINNCQFAHLNKNNTLVEYQEEVAAGAYNSENLQVVRELHFDSEKALQYFSSLLLNDFDFITGTGNSCTDDYRVKSYSDYTHMTEEERKTVNWYRSGIAVYFNNKLKFVIDAQGHNYSRYVGLVENVNITKNNPVKQLVNNERIAELTDQANTLTDYSTETISDLNIIDTWQNEAWTEYKEAIKAKLKANNFRLTKEIIQQLPGDSVQLKAAMYRLLEQINSIQEQFKDVDLQQGDKITMFYMGGMGGIITQRGTFDSVTNSDYAGNKAVKVTFKPERKRKLYYKHHYSELLIYKGWHDLPASILNEELESTGTGCTITGSRFSSCDKAQFKAIVDYFAGEGLQPVVNTCN